MSTTIDYGVYIAGVDKYRQDFYNKFSINQKIADGSFQSEMEFIKNLESNTIGYNADWPPEECKKQRCLELVRQYLAPYKRFLESIQVPSLQKEANTLVNEADIIPLKVWEYLISSQTPQTSL